MKDFKIGDTVAFKARNWAFKFKKINQKALFVSYVTRTHGGCISYALSESDIEIKRGEYKGRVIYKIREFNRVRALLIERIRIDDGDVTTEI